MGILEISIQNNKFVSDSLHFDPANKGPFKNHVTLPRGGRELTGFVTIWDVGGGVAECEITHGKYKYELEQSFSQL